MEAERVRERKCQRKRWYDGIKEDKKISGLTWEDTWAYNNNNNRFTALCPGLPRWAGTRRNTHPPTHHPDHCPIFISFFHLPWCIAPFLFKLRAWQCFCTTSLHVLFGLPLGLEPSTSYSIHFFTQSVSSFRNTCPHHLNDGAVRTSKGRKLKGKTG